VRRSIDDDQVVVPPGREDDDLKDVNWSVSIVDDYDDAQPRVVLTTEEVGSAGYGFDMHMPAEQARRLRLALASALRELGEETGR
jgi:hypothetical protein